MLTPDQIRTKLKGYPEPVVEACLEFERTRDPSALNDFVLGVLDFYTNDQSGRDPSEPLPSESPADNLEVDSVTVAEVVFLLEGLIGIEIDDENLRNLRTREDLRRFVTETARSIPAR